MPRTARIQGASGYYHIIGRGIGKQILFEEETDYLFFLSTLDKYLKEESFQIIAYCLMENHFHLLLKIDSGMDLIMKKILTRYAFYYNSKYERTGHLFQDRYTSVPVENEIYLLSAVRYIHNNPAKAGICPADQYRWSSWRSYTGWKGIVETDLVLELLGGAQAFRDFSTLEDDTEHLEFREKRRLNDQSAQEIIRNKLQLPSGTQLQEMDRESRDAALRMLKKEGLSIRQIERLTGINRGIITRA